MKRVLIAAAVLTLVGCGDSYNDKRGVGDAPVGEVHEAPRQVWQNVDKYPNVVAFCIGADAVYTVTAEVVPVVVKDSANCAEGGILEEDGE
jgi:hypothetical protein